MISVSSVYNYNSLKDSSNVGLQQSASFKNSSDFVKYHKLVSLKLVFMALGINQVTYSNRKFCRSVCLSVPVLLL